MAWGFGGARKSDEAQEDAPQRGARLTGKDLEIAQEIVRKSLAADHEMIERYSMIPPTCSNKK